MEMGLPHQIGAISGSPLTAESAGIPADGPSLSTVSALWRSPGASNLNISVQKYGSEAVRGQSRESTMTETKISSGWTGGPTRLLCSFASAASYLVADRWINSSSEGYERHENMLRWLALGLLQ